MDELREEAVANILLNRGVGFRIPAPVLLRAFGKKSITLKVRPLRLGTLIQLSTLPIERIDEKIAKNNTEMNARVEAVKAMGGEAVQVKMDHIADSGKKVSRLIAIGLLNASLRIRLLERLLGRHLYKTCTADQLQELTMWLFAYGRAESFMITTKLLQAMRVTAPRNLGQSEEMS